MNVSEARLRIHTLMSEAMFVMVDGPDLSGTQREELREDMANAADVLLEVLDLKVDSVDGKYAKTTLRLEEDD
jgi:hypothetical protein